jgi:glycosyltransferase involved in cell wall biosynthesis
MRVLFVTNSLPTPERPALGAFVADQIESVRETGADAEVLLADRATLGALRAYRGLGPALREAVDRDRPDVVHVMYGGVMAGVVTRTVRERPVLVSFCGSDVLGGRAGGVAGVSERLGLLASRRAARMAAGVVVKSRALLGGLPALDPSRTWILPNGVDLSAFAPQDQAACQAALGLDPGRRHVIFPASPQRPEKRFPLAEAAVAALDPALRVELHALDGEPRERFATWLNAADVILMTSAYEGSPNAIKEALACEVPVVSVDVGDVAERIAGIDGCHLAAAEPEDLAAKLALALGRGGRVDARDRMLELSRERVAERLCEIYAVLAAGDRARKAAA